MSNTYPINDEVHFVKKKSISSLISKVISDLNQHHKHSKENVLGNLTCVLFTVHQVADINGGLTHSHLIVLLALTHTQ